LKSKTAFTILIFITLAAAYLRLANLGVPSFWVDELDFVDAAKSMLRVGEPLLDSGYPYPRAPLQTYALMASFKLFGVSEFSSRLPSAIFGILSIPLLFIIGRGLFNERVGLLSALFLAVSPFAIGWSRGCRMYALFQLLFLAGVYFFYRGFENPPVSPFKKGGAGEFPLDKGGRPVVSPLEGGLRGVFRRWQRSLPYLLLAGFFLLLSYSTHQNAGLFLLTFIAYLLMMGISSTVKEGFIATLKSKYVILLTAILGGLVLAYIVLPPIREFVSYAAEYQPKWAEVASAQNPWRIFDFFFGSEKLPFNLLFIGGTILIFKSWNRAGVFALLTFFIPVVLFSFVFQYRKNDYVFHVYPLFYLIGAVALDFVIVKLSEVKFFDAVVRRFAAAGKTPPLIPPQGGNRPVRFSKNMILTVVCILWLPFTFNFRFAQKIPRLPDGNFNGAIYHNEWKEAAAFLKDKISEGDVFISTLPLTVKHYVGRAEYNLNISNSDLAREKNIVAADGRLIDFYSGADIIEDVAELQSVLDAHPNGWLVVDNYRFENDVYVPAAMREFMLTRAKKVHETKNKTVSVYRWEKASVPPSGDSSLDPTGGEVACFKLGDVISNADAFPQSGSALPIVRVRNLTAIDPTPFVTVFGGVHRRELNRGVHRPSTFFDKC
jgi:4-amino-4-deoxy-L-arabinose transferase-like glycosyltransferase